MLISIFTTDLKAYNQGTLSGKWISLPLAKDKLVHGITEVLSYGKNNEHEEIFITDYE